MKKRYGIQPRTGPLLGDYKLTHKFAILPISANVLHPDWANNESRITVWLEWVWVIQYFGYKGWRNEIVCDSPEEGLLYLHQHRVRQISSGNRVGNIYFKNTRV